MRNLVRFGEEVLEPGRQRANYKRLNKAKQ